eukprot:1486372-Prymnesium_polylepis.1
MKLPRGGRRPRSRAKRWRGGHPARVRGDPQPQRPLVRDAAGGARLDNEGVVVLGFGAEVFKIVEHLP